MICDALCLRMALCAKPALRFARLRHAASIELMEGIGTVGSRLLPPAFAAQGTTVPIWRGSSPPDRIR